MKFLSKFPNRSNNDSSMGMKLLGISKPPVCSGDCKADGLHSYCGCKAVGFTVELGRGDKIKVN